MARPERLAVALVQPMAWCITLLRPVVWLYSRAADVLFRVLACRRCATTASPPMTSWQPWRPVPVPAALAAREQQVITNVFELDTRMVSSAMSPRDRVASSCATNPIW